MNGASRCLATVCPEFGPQARTVVLREVDVASRTLLLYTDARSPKVAQLQADPRAAAVLVADAGLAAAAGRAHPGQHRRAGRDLALGAAAPYPLRRTISPLSPGQPFDDTARRPMAMSRARARPKRRSTARAASRAHFAVMRLRVRRMDWLSLDPRGIAVRVFDARDAALSGRFGAPLRISLAACARALLR